jgi:hypothetical protein
MRKNHRFVEWLPTIGRLVQYPLLATALLSILSLPLMAVSWHWAISPFCALSFIYLIRLDWALCERLALPPLALLLMVPTLGATFGVPLYVKGLGADFIPVFAQIQLMQIASCALIALGYRISRGFISVDWYSKSLRGGLENYRRQLRLLVWILCLIDLVRIVVGWRTGSLDRGWAGEALIDQRLGAWTFVGVFSRVNNMWFIFLPYFWRIIGSGERIVVVVIVAVYAVISFASGSRGLFLYPIILFGLGSFLLIDRARFKPEKWLPLVLVLFASYLYLIDVYRGTSAFQDSRLADLGTRLEAIKGVGEAAAQRADFALTTGRALIGAADDVILSATPEEVPYFGGADILPAIAWTYVPQTIAPDKPTLWDANAVVYSYTLNRQERSFASISLGADLYRRFGWIGFIVGLFTLGLIYGFWTRYVVATFTRRDRVLGLMFIGLLLGGLHASYSATVLQTWWIWAYDIPKHVIFLSILVFLVRAF